jgi:ABC-type multidrug transport system permease subunit
LFAQFFLNSSVAIVSAQSALIVGSVFTGGVLISESEVPDYWSWLQAISFFFPSSAGISTRLFDSLVYECKAQITGDGKCR